MIDDNAVLAEIAGALTKLLIVGIIRKKILAVKDDDNGCFNIQQLFETTSKEL